MSVVTPHSKPGPLSVAPMMDWTGAFLYPVEAVVYLAD